MVTLIAVSLNTSLAACSRSGLMIKQHFLALGKSLSFLPKLPKQFATKVLRPYSILDISAELWIALHNSFNKN